LAENVGRHGKNEKFGHKISWEKVEYLGVDAWIISKWMFKKEGV
jgi:hypothetical protein